MSRVLFLLLVAVCLVGIAVCFVGISGQRQCDAGPGDCDYVKKSCRTWISGSTRCARGIMSSADTYRDPCAGEIADTTYHETDGQCGNIQLWVGGVWIPWDTAACGGWVYISC